MIPVDTVEMRLATIHFHQNALVPIRFAGMELITIERERYGGRGRSDPEATP
jgi:hypothetical protein